MSIFSGGKIQVKAMVIKRVVSIACEAILEIVEARKKFGNSFFIAKNTTISIYSDKK